MLADYKVVQAALTTDGRASGADGLRAGIEAMQDAGTGLVERLRPVVEGTTERCPLRGAADRKRLGVHCECAERLQQARDTERLSK